MKILYFMHVDWNWIKQRPHFIAEGLSQNNEVIVYYPHSYHRKGVGFCDNKSDSLVPHKFYNLPFRGRFRIIDWLNPIYLKLYFSIVIGKNKPDAIWIPRPDYINYIPSQYKKKIVYDCMDDYYSMSNDEEVLECEKALVHNCGKIIASSISLISKLETRYGVEEEQVTLIRNGYGGAIIGTSVDQHDNKNFSLCYVGTVSSWFDFDVLNYLLDNVDNLEIHVIGPVDKSVAEKAERYSSDRMVFHGSVDHSKLYEVVSGYDCMVMPFVINEIIESVDPVKLYEYINYNKNILTIKYREIERFDEFVYFYNTKEEALSELKNIIQNPNIKYTNNERIKFLNENSWDHRVDIAETVLNQIKVFGIKYN